MNETTTEAIIIDDAAEERDKAIAKATAAYHSAIASRDKAIAEGRWIVYRGVVIDFVFSAWYDGGKVNDDGTISPCPTDAVFIKGQGFKAFPPKIGDPAAIDAAIDAMYVERGMTPPPIPDEKPWDACMAFTFRYAS